MTRDDRDLTRRRLLGLGLLTAGAITLESLPGAAEALARSTGGPTATSAAIGLPGGRRIGPVAVPGGFDLAGLRWAGGSHPRIELRARRTSGRWTEWLPISNAHDHGPDGAPQDGASDPVWTGRADQVQVRADRPLHGLTLHTVRTAGTERGPRARAAQVVAGSPPIIIRESWGAGALKTRGTPSYGSVQVGFVHHTVTANDYGPADSVAIVLAIAKYHINSNRWNDIGYNFLVDKYGQIFEGRAGGIDQAVIGAQAQGFNSVSTSISNIGTFESEAQTDAALNAQAQLLAWKLALHGVTVDGVTEVVSAGGSSSRYPKGRTVALNNISGHRDGCKTSCPGTTLYLQLPEIRRRALAKDYPVAAPPEQALTVAAAAAEVAAYSDVEVTGTLADIDGGPVAGAEVRIQKLGATRWSTAARARTDADGRFAVPVLVRQSSRIRAYYNGQERADRQPLTSPEINVAAVPSMTVSLSAKHIPVGGVVSVRAALKPHRSNVELTVTKKGRDGRYRTVRRARLTVKGSTGLAAVRLTKPGLYGFAVSAAADARATAVTTPLIHVRVARGAKQGDPVRVRAGGGAEPPASESASGGGVAARVR